MILTIAAPAHGVTMAKVIQADDLAETRSNTVEFVRSDVSEGLAPKTLNRVGGETVTAGQTLTVGIKEFQPFVFLPEDDNTRAYGYSIDLWNAIAEKQGLQTQFVAYKSVPELLQAVQSGQVDAAISGLSITSERLRGELRFSYPYYQSGLQLMVNRDQRSGFTSFLGFLRNWSSMRAVLLVLGSSAMVGGLVWALEHRHNEGFPRSPVAGIGQGFWFAIVTLGTFGYGDVTPLRLPARIITSVWMGISFFIVANFISSMTAKEIAGTVGGLDDLRGEEIGVVADTTAESYLLSQPVKVKGYESFDDAVEALAEGDIKGVVRDYPEVQYLVSRNPAFEVVGDRLTREDYGIAVSDDNLALMEAIDYSLVVLQERGTLRSLDAKWFSLELASSKE